MDTMEGTDLEEQKLRRQRELRRKRILDNAKNRMEKLKSLQQPQKRYYNYLAIRFKIQIIPTNWF